MSHTLTTLISCTFVYVNNQYDGCIEGGFLRQLNAVFLGNDHWHTISLIEL